MARLRSHLVVALSLSLISFAALSAPAASSPVGILTLATHAHLDEATAFPGLSVFEGEHLSTEADGRVGLRSGQSVLTLGGRTEVALIPLDGVLHVDLETGSIHFSSGANELIEVHVGEALLRPVGSEPARATISVLSLKVLQITPDRSRLNFSYRQESRNLPEGQTYRIYLDSSDGTQEGGGAGIPASSAGSKVGYYIVGAGVAGAGAWGLHDALRQGNPPSSPTKP